MPGPLFESDRGGVVEEFDGSEVFTIFIFLLLSNVGTMFSYLQKTYGSGSAIELCARKVAAMTGDARKAMQVARRSVLLNYVFFLVFACLSLQVIWNLKPLFIGSAIARRHLVAFH